MSPARAKPARLRERVMNDTAPARSPFRLGASAWLGLTLAVVALDQWTKALIIDAFAEFDAIVLLPVLEIMRLHNEGAAFSFLADASGWQRWAFIVLGLVVSLGICVWLLRLPARGQSLLAAGLSLVMGGALGNVIDRIRFGYVVDFIRVHYEQWYFPAFNVADSAITVGAALLILDSLIHRGPAEAKPPPGS
jgi:signal peptidase II